MHRLTASKVEQAMLCEASVVLPAQLRTGQRAENGTAIHAFLARALTVGKERALEEVPLDKHAEYERIDLSWIDVANPEIEPAYVYDSATDTAIKIGNNVGRAYGNLATSQIAGSADVVFRPATGDMIVVIDFKTGSTEQASAADHWQLKTLCLMAARHAGAASARGIIAQLRRDGSWSFSEADFDALELDIVAGEVKQLLSRVHAASERVQSGAQPDVRPSERACRWCECVASCPAAVTAAIKLSRPSMEHPAAPEISALSSTEAGAVWEQLLLAERFLRHVRAGLEALAAREPLILPDGRRVQPVETTREYVNAAIAYDVLSRSCDSDEMRRAFELKTSATAIKRALNGKAQAALDAIRQEGGFEQKTTVSIKEVKP